MPPLMVDDDDESKRRDERCCAAPRRRTALSSFPRPSSSKTPPPVVAAKGGTRCSDLDDDDDCDVYPLPPPPPSPLYDPERAAMDRAVFIVDKLFPSEGDLDEVRAASFFSFPFVSLRFSARPLRTKDPTPLSPSLSLSVDMYPTVRAYPTLGLVLVFKIEDIADAYRHRLADTKSLILWQYAVATSPSS